MIYQLLFAIVPVVFLMAACTLVEVISPKDRYTLRERFPGALFTASVPGALVLFSWWISPAWEAIGVPPVVDISDWNPILKALFLFLLFDLLHYWEHRFEHRFYWPVHAVHHSVTQMHAANGYGHPLQAVPQFFLIVVPMSLVESGGAKIPIVLATILLLQNLIIHSPLRVHLGPLRHIWVDNRFHRIHHSLEPRHFDKNFGIGFSFWDRLFGTAYHPRNEEWPASGVEGLTQPDGWRSYLLQPLLHFRSEPRTAKQVAKVQDHRRSGRGA